MDLAALNNSALDEEVSKPMPGSHQYAHIHQTAAQNLEDSTSTTSTTSHITAGSLGNKIYKAPKPHSNPELSHITDQSSSVSLLDSCDWPSVMLSQYKADCHRLAVPHNPMVISSMKELLFVIPAADANGERQGEEVIGQTRRSDKYQRSAANGLSERRNPNNAADMRGSVQVGGKSKSISPEGYGSVATSLNPQPMAATFAVDQPQRGVADQITHTVSDDENNNGVNNIGSGRRVLCFALANTTLGPRGAMALAAALRGVPLTILSLSECFLEDEGCRVICQTIASDPLLSQSLLEIDLRGNAIRSAGPVATALVACQNLQSLRISWNKIGLLPSQTSALIAAARTHRSLVSLDLSNNALDQQVLLALAELVLAQVPQLTHIDLSWNLLGAGAGGAALHGALIRNNSLLALSVNGNGFTRQEIEGITDKLAANERMHWDARNAVETQRLLATEGRRLREQLQRELMLRREAEVARDHFAAEITLLSEKLLSARATGDATTKQLTADNATLEAKMIEEKIESNAKVRDAESRSDEYRKRCDEATAAAQNLRIELESKSRTYFEVNESNKTLISSQQREISLLKEQLSTTQAQLTQSTEDCKRAHEEIADKRLANVQLNTELAVAKEENARRSSENTARQAEIGVLEARVRDMATELATLKGQITSLESENTKHRFDTFDAENRFKLEVQRAHDEGDLRLKRLADDHAQALKVREAAYEALQQELNRQRDEAAVDRNRLATQLQLLATVETEKRKAIMDLQASQQAVRRAESNEQLAVEQHRHLQTELSAMHEEQQGRMEELEQQLRRQYAPMEAALKHKDDAIRRLEREVQRLITEGKAEKERQAEAAARLEAKLLSDFKSTLHKAIANSSGSEPIQWGNSAEEVTPLSAPTSDKAYSPVETRQDLLHHSAAPAIERRVEYNSDVKESRPQPASVRRWNVEGSDTQKLTQLPLRDTSAATNLASQITTAAAHQNAPVHLSVPSLTAPVALRGPLSAAAAAADKAPQYTPTTSPSTLSTSHPQIASSRVPPTLSIATTVVAPAMYSTASTKPPLPFAVAKSTLLVGPQKGLPPIATPSTPQSPMKDNAGDDVAQNEGIDEEADYEEYGEEYEEEVEEDSTSQAAQLVEGHDTLSQREPSGGNIHQPVPSGSRVTDVAAKPTAESPTRTPEEPSHPLLPSIEGPHHHVDPSVVPHISSPPLLSPPSHISSPASHQEIPAPLMQNHGNTVENDADTNDNSQPSEMNQSSPSSSRSSVPARLKKDSDDDYDDFEQSSDASDF